MTTKDLFVLGIWAIAIILFFLVGFDIVRSTKYVLVSLGLGLGFFGFLLDRFWKTD